MVIGFRIAEGCLHLLEGEGLLICTEHEIVGEQEVGMEQIMGGRYIEVMMLGIGNSSHGNQF